MEVQRNGAYSKPRSRESWFGGKSKVGHIVWSRFGDTSNYVEPFFGSGAVMLARPHDAQLETINDFDGFVSNFWRAVKSDPVSVAEFADWPVNENDLHARHGWLISQRLCLTEQLEGDPEYFDAKIAGWWVWGISQWIGTGWCSGKGPWIQIEGNLVDSRKLSSIEADGITRQMPHLAGTQGINKGSRQNNERLASLINMMEGLSERFRNTRVCCGDWSRICGPSPTYFNGVTSVFLDPPYSSAEHAVKYAAETDVSHLVRQYAIDNGHNPLLRIALCGYDGEHQMPDDWECLEWKSSGGYGSQGDGRGRDNANRERIWFSPHCLKPIKNAQVSMFEDEDQ